MVGEEKSGDALNEIMESFESLRSNFRNAMSVREVNKSTLNEYQHRFLDIRSSLRPFKNQVNSKWLRMDDKAATAFKSRIAIALSKGEIDGYDSMSLNQADKFASSTPQYKEFLDKRAFYKESLVNIDDVRGDCLSYINLIKDYIKDTH